MKKLTILFMFIILSSLALAVPPITSEFVGDVELKLQINQFTTYEYGLPRWNNIHIYNSTNGDLLTPSTDNIHCQIHLINSQGFEIAEQNASENGDHWYLNGSSILPLGVYSYDIHCQHDDADLGGFVQGEFEIINKNIISPEKSQAILFAIGLFAFLLLTFSSSIDYEKHWALKFLILILVVICLFLIGTMALNIHEIGFNLYRLSLAFASLFLIYVSIFIFQEIMSHVKVKKSMKKNRK